MKQVLSMLLAFSIFFSCQNTSDNSTDKTSKPKSELKKPDPKTDSPNDQHTQSKTSTPTDDATALFTNFDWSNVPISNAKIGTFPYLTAPENFIIAKKGSSSKVSETGMTKYYDFSKLICYDGNNLFEVKGERAELRIRMAERKMTWNKLKFDKSVSEYILSLGAKLITDKQIPKEKLKALKAIEKRAVYEYMSGISSTRNSMSHYALNHSSGKIIFQVFSNSSSGTVGVVKLEDFVQTIKAPTANEMKKEIEATGKAILYINFDIDKATLKPDGETVVDEISKLLNENPDLKLSIEGHTDNTGTAARNKQLSIDRANTVMNALTAKGIDASRLKATGYGSAQPLVANDSAENKAKNRRVELVKN